MIGRHELHDLRSHDITLEKGSHEHCQIIGSGEQTGIAGNTVMGIIRIAVMDFALNEKCAAGAGAFTEAMSRALEVSVEELGQMSLRSEKATPMNAQCAVFAESEVVSLLHNKTPKEDISRAVHDAIASRIVSLARKVGFEPDVVFIGGVAHNAGFVDSLERALECKVTIPEHPEYVGAYGAALAAAES